METNPRDNISILLGLVDVWNNFFQRRDISNTLLVYDDADGGGHLGVGGVGGHYRGLTKFAAFTNALDKDFYNISFYKERGVSARDGIKVSGGVVCRSVLFRIGCVH